MHQQLNNIDQVLHPKKKSIFNIVKTALNLFFSLSVLVLWCVFIIFFTLNNGEMLDALNWFYQIGYIVGTVAVGLKIFSIKWGLF